MTSPASPASSPPGECRSKSHSEQKGKGVGYGNMREVARFRARHGPLDEPASPGVASILHVDMDVFDVSGELLERPALRGKPVVVGGQCDQRGVVSAASYEARQYGIHSAMPLRTAGRLCPHAIFLDLRHKLYSEWSDRVATILAKFSPIVEMVSIDEAYLDLAGTERLHGPPLAAADKLLRTITRTTGLPCSGGLAATRLVAKVASDQAKPRGLLWAAPGSDARFLPPRSVRTIPGLATRTLPRTIRYAGFDTYARSKTLSEPTQFDADIFAVFQSLFREHRDHARKIRLLGVSLSGLAHGAEQLDLLAAERRSRLEKLTRAADHLRDRFGFGSVQFGGSLRSGDSDSSDEHSEKE